MELLLDTHILLWALTDHPKLPKNAREKIMDERNTIFYSTASVWEVSIKHSIHPANMPVSGKELSEYCAKAGYQMLVVRDDHVYALETLCRAESAPKHQDPFDRILIAQAKSEKLTFITHDANLSYYQEDCIMSV